MTTTRRTQEERAARTRDAVLRAAIDCLVDLGYAGTSTTAIQQRAGVSRGALTHHFPSRDALLIAAVDHLAERRDRELRDRAQALPRGADRDHDVLRMVYEQFDSDLFRAALELWTASRTDPVLHDALRRAERAIGRRNRALLRDILSAELSERPGFDQALEVLLEWLRGVAVTDIVRPGGRDVDRVVAHGIQLLEAVGVPPEGRPGGEGPGGGEPGGQPR